MQRVDWDDLKCVAALAEGGSVRRAGALLGIHGATVARHLERLEHRLGVKLFARGRHGMTLTVAGRRVLEAHEQVRTTFLALERDLAASGSEYAGPVELVLPDALAAGWMVARLSTFATRHPDIDLTVRTAEDIPVFEPGAATAALVLSDAPPDDLVGRRLGTLAISGYRAESLPAGDTVQAHGPTPASAERVIGPLASALARAWIASERTPAVEASLHCREIAAQVVAARAGLGVAVLPCVVGDATPGLVRTEPARPLEAGGVWLLSHPDSRGIARLQALLGFVQESWIIDRARLEGQAAGA
ncbi:MAG: LysR family transcriptional regulator [Pseudomonadales bacterium]|nr:LysR family transcriptional regulator [Pseudomonadales bacterium]